MIGFFHHRENTVDAIMLFQTTYSIFKKDFKQREMLILPCYFPGLEAVNSRFRSICLQKIRAHTIGTCTVCFREIFILHFLEFFVNLYGIRLEKGLKYRFKSLKKVSEKSILKNQSIKSAPK